MHLLNVVTVPNSIIIPSGVPEVSNDPTTYKVIDFKE